MFPQPLVSVLHVKDLVHEEKYDPKWDVVLAGLVDRGPNLEVAGQVTCQIFFRFASFLTIAFCLGPFIEKVACFKQQKSKNEKKNVLVTMP